MSTEINMVRWVLAMATAVAIGVGCSGGTQSSDTGADQNSTSKICGGFAGLTCPTGYSCQMPEPHHPDQSGTCVKDSTKQICGGFAGLTCPTGYSCQMPEPHHPDQSGTCVKDSTNKGPIFACGGIAGISCPAGYTCQMSEPHYPDQSGTCVQDTSSSGVTCLTLTCKSGYHCEPATNGGDATCVADAGGDTTVEGTMRLTMGPGGETTGTSIDTGSKLVEILLTSDERSQFSDGKKARATGSYITVTGVAIKSRQVLKVTDFLACPSAASINCMPPVDSAKASVCSNQDWISANCDGVTFLN